MGAWQEDLYPKRWDPSRWAPTQHLPSLFSSCHRLWGWPGPSPLWVALSPLLPGPVPWQCVPARLPRLLAQLWVSPRPAVPVRPLCAPHPLPMPVPAWSPGSVPLLSLTLAHQLPQLCSACLSRACPSAHQAQPGAAGQEWATCLSSVPGLSLPNICPHSWAAQVGAAISHVQDPGYPGVEAGGVGGFDEGLSAWTPCSRPCGPGGRQSHFRSGAGPDWGHVSPAQVSHCLGSLSL